MVSFSKIGSFGRLGNQLFQIANLVSYSKKNNCEWTLPQWEYEEHFNEKFKKTHHTKTNNQFKYLGTEYKKIPDMGCSVDFYGYFQSEKYFEDYKDEIKKIFTPKTFYLNKIKNTNNINFDSTECVIHVRRGDYLKLKHFLGIEYYTKSIEKMKSRGVTKFFVVSDDIVWCEKNFKDSNFQFIKNNTDIEDLFLMTMFKNIIIANSSFSWWGAYLGERKNVICPKTPFRDWKSFDDYYPNDWEKVDN
jgi:hypothetical protein